MRRRERGAALILVLAAVAVLTAVAVELAARSGTDAVRAARSSRDAAFRRLFDSGNEVARGLLAESDPGPFTFWGEPWNIETSFSLGPGGRASVRLADESGKINVARIYSHPDEQGAIRAQVGRLFDYVRRHDSARAKEWRDVAAKVDARLRSPATLLSLDGLREAGITAAQVFGPAGLSRYLTCFGDGPINVNTAPRAVLAAMSEEIDDALADRIAAFRGKQEGPPGRYKPFEDPKDLVLVDGIVVRVTLDGETRISRNVFERVQGLVTVKSACFSARIEAEVDGRRREAWAFFKPDGRRIAWEEVMP